jgi:hypothetical protein
VDSLRKAPATNTLIDEYGIDVLAALWLKVGQMIVVRAEGGDPNVITPAKALTYSRGRIYATLDWLTSQFTEAFFDRDSRFEPRRLWDFFEQVDRWRRGDRSPATVLRISSSWNIARTELNRLLQRVTASNEIRGPSSDQTENHDQTRLKAGLENKSPHEISVSKSHWKVDGQIISTLKVVGHRLTTTELLSEMKNRNSEDFSESTVKKRLAKMVLENRLTNDRKGEPPGYGLPEWGGSPGS